MIGLNTSQNVTAPKQRRRIQREIESRDWNWLYTGEAPSVKYTSEQVRKRVLPQELRTAQRLSSRGIRSVFIQDYKWIVEDGIKRKIGLPDFRDGTEIKTLQSSKNPYGAIDNYLENSTGKDGLKRVIVDNSESTYIDDNSLIEAAQDIWNDYPDIPKLALLLKSGDLIHLYK